MQRFIRAAVVTGAVAGLGVVVPALGAGATEPDVGDDVFISEIHYDNDGTDTGEAVEVFGPAGTDLGGWEIVLYNGTSMQRAPYDTRALSGSIPDLDGTGFGVVVESWPTNGIQNGAPDGIALVDDTGDVVEFLSYEGSFVAASGPATGLTSVDIGVSQPSDTPVGTSLQRLLDGSWNPAGSVCASFGELNDPDAPATCPLPPAEVKIHEIQNGPVSPLVGDRVIVEGVVVGDHEGSSPALGGIFVQEEDVDADADITTSEGIFVFTGGADTAAVGDLVRVEGTVQERFGNTQLSEFAEVDVLASGEPLPLPAEVTFPVADVTDLEWYEGMLATFPDTLVISEYFNYDRFGEIVVAKPVAGEERVMNPTAVFPPESAEAAERASLNERSRITVDDGLNSQNPVDPIHPITRDPLTIDNLFRGGDTVTGLTGPVYFGFGLYRVLPYAEPYGGVAGFDEYVRTVAPATPDEVGGDLRVVSLNALNYFLTLDAPGEPGCGPDRTAGCRGADTTEELERQRVKLLNTLEVLDADVIGLNEVENSRGVEPLADLVDGLNERGIGTYDHVAAGEDSVVGSDAIKTGLIYRVGAVTPLGDPVVLDDQGFVNPFDEATDKNRAAVAQTFVDDATGEVFSVVVNHLKSKGSPCADGTTDPDLTGNCDATRLAAVEYLLDWIETDPTGVADDDWLIIGDLNAYDEERPIRALVDAGWSDLIAAYQGELAYSFAFDGELGYLDYVVASPSMAPQVTGATEWHINADEPDVIDYDTTFKSPAQIATFDPTTPFRSSDHDPALAGITLDSGIEASATPDELWPPNGKLRDVAVTAGDGTDASFAVEVLGVTSSDPDAGTFGGDRPGDIVIGDDGSLQLRAERAGRIGSRTYTIEVQASGDDQVRFTDTTVVVPHDQRGRSDRR